MATNEKPPLEGQNAGGQGVLTDPHHVRSDCALVRRAIRNEWPVSDRLKETIMARLELIVENDEDDDKAIAAARTVISADSVNARREATEVAASKPATAASVVNNNTQVNVNVQADVPITEQGRLEEALALLDAARARAVLAADGAAPVEVRPAPADDAAG